MATIAFTAYHAFYKALANKEADFNSDTLRATLHTSSYTPNRATHDYVDDLTNELSTAGGYTAGGAALTSPSITVVAANSWSQSWATATAYTVGQIRRPTTGNTFIYRVTVAGTSHASTEPTWPTTVGATVTDGTVTWTCVGTGAVVLSFTGGVIWPSFSAGPFRYIVIADYTPGTNATRPLIGYFDYGSDQTGGGGDFTITPDTSAGLITIPIP